MYKGWIKLHRQFLDWEWYSEPNCLRVFLHCLLKANHKDKAYRGTLIKRGTFVTSFEVMQYELTLTTQQLRTVFKKLESTGEINKQSTSKGTVITVCNYNAYQEEEFNEFTDSNKQTTNQQQTNNKQSTTTKNDKNVNNDKNVKKNPPNKAEALVYFEGTGKINSSDLEIESENFINYYSGLGWKHKNGKKIHNWKLQASTWANNYVKFNKNKNDRWSDPF